jgi:DNA-directed RNA polymerase specialized sigma24 family protein
MDDFRRRPQSELDRLDEQELVDYLDGAREAGDTGALKDALGYLAWRFEGIVKARVVAKVPADDVEDVTMEVLKSIVRGGFDGKLIAEFGAWVRTVTKRRIADFHRERERQPRLGPIDAGEDERVGPEPETEEETGTIVIVDAVERVLAGRSELHQRVIRLYGPGMCGFEDLPAADVCERLAADGEPMSVDNVAQIWSRFKRDLRKDLDA